MAAEIRSEVIAPVPKAAVDNASRDDLAVNDVVQLTAIAGGTTFQWTLVFVPEGSGAVLIPPADVTTAGPLQFTVDLVGPYLVRLVVDAGLATESTQYVRLRALTSTLGLHLVAAGERRDSSGVIPVDVDIEGWANEQNSNLLALETAASNNNTERYIAFDVNQAMLSGASPDTFSATSQIPDNAYVTEMSVLVSAIWDGAAMSAEVGDGATADRYMAAGDSNVALAGRYIVTLWDQNTSGGGLPATLTLTYGGVGTVGALTIIAKYVENPAS